MILVGSGTISSEKLQIAKGKKIEKPWGYELLWAHTDNYIAKILFVKAGDIFVHERPLQGTVLDECLPGTTEKVHTLIEIPWGQSECQTIHTPRYMRREDGAEPKPE